MSNKKNLLEESTVRKFMGLAGLKPITVSNFVNEEYVSLEEEADGLEEDAKSQAQGCPEGAHRATTGGDKGQCVDGMGRRVAQQEESIELEEADELEEGVYDEDMTEQEEELPLGDEEEPPMGDEEEPPMEDEPEMDMEEEPAEEEKEVTIDPEEAEILVKLADKLRDLVGEPEEEGLPAEEEEEEMGGEELGPEMMMEQLVERIASRVAKRLLEKKTSKK